MTATDDSTAVGRSIRGKAESLVRHPADLALFANRKLLGS